MNKARLIKREEAEALGLNQRRRRKAKKQPVVRRTATAISEWISERKVQTTDARSAFAALFTQPTTQS